MSSHIDCTYRVSPAHILSCKAKVRISAKYLFALCAMCVCKTYFILNVISQRLQCIYRVSSANILSYKVKVRILEKDFLQCVQYVIAKLISSQMSSLKDCEYKVSPVYILSCKVKVKIPGNAFLQCVVAKLISHSFIHF